MVVTPAFTEANQAQRRETVGDDKPLLGDSRRGPLFNEKRGGGEVRGSNVFQQARQSWKKKGEGAVRRRREPTSFIREPSS